MHRVCNFLNIFRTTRQPFVFTTILRRTSFKIERDSTSFSPLTTSTKRQPKVVPQFASSTSSSSNSNDFENRNNENTYLVDGFVIGKPNNDIDKDYSNNDSRQPPDEKDKNNRKLPNLSQGTTPRRAIEAILESPTEKPNEVQNAGPGIIEKVSSFTIRISVS